MVLKPLSAALRDGNTIRAIIKATGANQDGRTNGITLPSAIAQEALIREVYAKANLDPNDTAYVEAHGTGTPAGDPLEAEALERAFNTKERKEPLFIGSVKGAIGHTEGAAGVAGLIKATLALEAGVIPPMANFESPNPEIPFGDWNIKLPINPIPWPPALVKQVSVNSFGFGGANAHAVLQSAGNYKMPVQPALTSSISINGNGVPHLTNGDSPEGQSEYADTNPTNGYSAARQHKCVLVLSSADEQGISRQCAKLSQYISKKPEKALSLRNLAYSLYNKRSHLRWRSFKIVAGIKDLVSGSASAWSKAVPSGTSGRLGFVFTGQGAQWPTMGQSLLVYRPYRESIYAASKFMSALGSPWILAGK
jgi:acyl transferase domain-containing protein